MYAEPIGPIRTTRTRRMTSPPKKRKRGKILPQDVRILLRLLIDNSLLLSDRRNRS